MSGDFWIFGYGSLIFKPGFEFAERVVGRVRGYERRFWQASEDHRGTPENPGRVVTLVAIPEGECWGVAYRVHEEQRHQVTAQLDEREKGGYGLVQVPFLRRGSGPGPDRVQVYLGHEDNPQFVGPEDDETTAAIIRESKGPSGHNVEYLLRLAEALIDLDVVDPHVLCLANMIIDPSGVLLEE